MPAYGLKSQFRTAIKSLMICFLIGISLVPGSTPVQAAVLGDPSPAPLSDNRSEATTIDNPGGVVEFTENLDISGATNEPADPLFPILHHPTTGYQTVWYKFTPFASGLLRIKTYGSDYDTLLGVWRENDLGELETKPVRWNDNAGGHKQSYIAFYVTPGSVYEIEAAAKTLPATMLNFYLKFTPLPSRNNSITSPYVVAGKSSEISFTNTQDVWSATTSLLDPVFYNFSQYYRTTWYRFKPKVSGYMSLDTSKSNYDTLLGVFYGPTNKLVLNAWDDDSGVNLRAKLLDVPVIGGITYYIEIASHEVYGPSQLIMDFSYRPGNAAANPGELDNPDPLIYRMGGWNEIVQDGAYQNTLSVSTSRWDAAALTFTGRHIRMKYAKMPDGGLLQVRIDGRVITTINQHNATPILLKVWKSPLLSAGQHTITLIHCGGVSVNFDSIIIE